MEYFPGGTAAQGGPRRGRPRPAGLPLQPRRPRRLGQLPGARARPASTRDTADPADGRIERDAGRRADRHAARGCGVHASRTGTCPARPRPTGRRRSWTAQAHLHSLGITGWQDAWVTPAREAYRALGGRRPADRARRRGAVVGPASRAGAGRRLPGPAREPAQPGRLPPDDGQDHDRRRAGELHRRAAGALLRRLRRPHRQPRAVLRRPATCSAPPSPSSTRSASRSTCTPSATAPCATPWTPWRRPARRTAARQPAPHRPHAGRAARRTSRASRELGVVANCQAYWAQTEPQMDELTIPFLGARPGRAAVPLRRPAARRAPARHGQRLVGDDRQPARGRSRSRSPASTRSDRDNAPFLPEQALAARRSRSPRSRPAPPTSTTTTDGGDTRAREAGPTSPCWTATCSPPEPARSPTARVELTVAGGRVVFDHAHAPATAATPAG